MSRCEDFDKSLLDLTDRRGTDYGHPADAFRRIAAMSAVIDECPDAQIKHALRMIAVKVCRLIEQPDHADSVHDIAGYARCIAMILDKREEALQEMVDQAQELNMGYGNSSGVEFSWSTPTTIIESD